MLTEVRSIEGRATRLLNEGPPLRALGLPHRAAALARVMAAIRSHTTRPAELELLARSSGLSVEMTRWGLETTLETFTQEALLAVGIRALEAEAPRAVAAPARLAAVVLSGNVFTAPARALALPLLLGVPTLAKASSRDDSLARLLAGALDEVAPDLSPCLEIVTSRGDDTDVLALVAQADVISVYGSDDTARAIRVAAPANTRVVVHGHGLGVAVVSVLPVGDELAALCDALADDVAAYDQRGCLSPHAVFVVGGADDAARLADGLAASLGSLAERCPRGPLPMPAAAAQMQWRGVAAARGTLHVGNDFAVSVEGSDGMRLSPGYRNITVHHLPSMAAVGEALAPLGAHLKVVGVGPHGTSSRALLAALPGGLAPRICPLGAMQRPALDSLWDAEPQHAGLLRYIELDERP